MEKEMKNASTSNKQETCESKQVKLQDKNTDEKNVNGESSDKKMERIPYGSGFVRRKRGQPKPGRIPIRFFKKKNTVTNESDKKVERIPYGSGFVRRKRGQPKPGRFVLTGSQSELLIFATVICVLLFVGSRLNFNKKTNGISPREALQKYYHEKLENRRTDPCSLFISNSSIPGVGFAYFAGRDFEEGELVLETAGLLMLTLHDKSNNPTSLFLPSHGLLLNHHPHTENVRTASNMTLAFSSGDLAKSDGDGDSAYGGRNFDLRATRHIRAGEELFIPYEQHLHNWLINNAIDPDSDIFLQSNRIPTAEDYDKANAIARDTTLAAKREQRNQNRRANNDFGADHIYSLTRQTVSHLNVKVAELLPSNAREARNRHNSEGPFSWTALKHKTLTYLQLNAHCASDIKLIFKNNKMTILATRDVQEGAIIVTLPLYAVKNAAMTSYESDSLNDDNGDDCDGGLNGYCSNKRERLPDRSSLLTCFGGSSNSSILLCPLTDAAFRPESSSKNGGGGADVANVAFRWTDETNRQLSVNEMLAAPVGSLSWNVIALKAIQSGEELWMDWKATTTAGDQSHLGGAQPFITVNDYLLPQHW